MIHDSPPVRRSTVLLQTSFGGSTQPGRQYSLSRYTTSTPRISPRRRANVDLPEPPEPMTITFLIPDRVLLMLNCARSFTTASAFVLQKQLDELARRRAEHAVAAVYDADRAPPLRAGERDDDELAAALLVEHRRPRDNRRAESDLDRALDRLDVVELRRALHADSVRAQYLVGRAPRRDVALEEDERLPLQVFGAQTPLLSERVAGPADKDEPVAGQRHDFQSAPLLRICDHAEVERATHNVAHDARRPAVFKVNLGLRVERHELAHDGRKLVQAHAVDRRHAHRPAHRPRELPHVLLKVRVGRQHLAARLVEGLARLRQAQLAPPAHALKQPPLELRLQPAHLLAHSRLRDEVALRGLREAARLDEVAEDFQGLDLHRGY